MNKRKSFLKYVEKVITRYLNIQRTTVGLIVAGLLYTFIGGTVLYSLGKSSVKVTPAMLQQCSSDAVFELLGMVAMYKTMGVPKEDILQALPGSGLSQEHQNLVRQHIDRLYATDDLEQFGRELYSECLNSKLS